MCNNFCYYNFVLASCSYPGVKGGRKGIAYVDDAFWGRNHEYWVAVVGFHATKAGFHAIIWPSCIIARADFVNKDYFIILVVFAFITIPFNLINCYIAVAPVWLRLRLE